MRGAFGHQGRLTVGNKNKRTDFSGTARSGAGDGDRAWAKQDSKKRRRRLDTEAVHEDFVGPPAELRPRPEKQVVTTEMALLAAVVANLDDNLPRLAYADWLEEQGGKDACRRAELIRVQIERASLPEDDSRQTALQQRERRLLAGVWPAWPWCSLPAWARPDAEYRRGFVAVVHCAARELEEDWEELLNGTPLEGVRFNLGGMWNALLAWPWLEHLTLLDLRDSWIGNEGIQALAACPGAKNLRELGVANTNVNADGVLALSVSTYLRNLTRLDLGSNAIGNNGARALADSPSLSGLTHLVLESAGIADSGALAVAFSPSLPNLSFLNLHGNEIGPAAAARLRERFGDRLSL
jgi:uncharacterized protein (TIGR02996 family)